MELMGNMRRTHHSTRVTEDMVGQEVVVAGFGGGDGLLNISYGANKSFANKAVKCLTKIGFLECT